jgi:Na+-translocating ferredoxin:NAD+ oxidoreductase subunit D
MPCAPVCQEKLLVTEIRQDPIFGDFRRPRLGMDRQLVRHRRPVADLQAGHFLARAGRSAGHRDHALSTPMWLLGPDTNPSPPQHIFSGALVLAAFFIATDPVSGCSTLRGKLPSAPAWPS